jgi:hypothetical protein
VGFKDVRFERCWFQNASFGGVVANQCHEFISSHCVYYKIARDACRSWNTSFTEVTNNFFLHNDDDCISINRAGFENVDGIVRSRIIVTGNFLQDTGGIRMQSPKDCVISNNVLNLTKGNAGISLEGITTADNREAPLQSILIEGNLILNTIDRLLSSRPNPTAQNSNFRVGIKLTSTPTNLGGLAALPRQNDTATGTIVAPYSYNYSDSGELNDQPIGLNHNITIRGNVVKRTLPAVTNYSDWGFGKMFSRFQNTGVGSPPAGYIVNGEVDPQIEDANLRVRSLEIRDGIQDSLIDSNLFEGSGLECVRFLAEQTTAADNQIINLTFKDNILRDFRSVGVDLTTDYANTTQSILFEGNTIDGDPFFQDTTARGTSGAGYDGTWIASGACIGLNLTDVSGCNLFRNSFKNVSNPYLLGSGQLTKGVREGNLLYGEPANGVAVNTFSTSNKGIGQYPTDMQYENSLVRVDSDPQSATYGHILVNGAKTTSGSAAPTEGYFFIGQWVPTRNASEVAGETVLGYRRKTNGDGHVLGTDWEELKANV